MQCGSDVCYRFTFSTWHSLDLGPQGLHECSLDLRPQGLHWRSLDLGAQGLHWRSLDLGAQAYTNAALTLDHRTYTDAALTLDHRTYTDAALTLETGLTLMQPWPWSAELTLMQPWPVCRRSRSRRRVCGWPDVSIVPMPHLRGQLWLPQPQSVGTRDHRRGRRGQFLPFNCLFVFIITEMFNTPNPPTQKFNMKSRGYFKDNILVLKYFVWSNLSVRQNTLQLYRTGRTAAL